MKHFIYILLFLFVVFCRNTAIGQQPVRGGTSISVSVSAEIIDYLELITIADIDVGTVIPSEDILRLDPRTAQGAGIIKVDGRENSSVQISFSNQVEMINAGSNSVLNVIYSVSGNDHNDQSTSVVFTTNPTNVLLDHNGEYYLWIGCEFSLADLVPGQYDGDFVIEVDYN